jgi:hypothetical protein
MKEKCFVLLVILSFGNAGVASKCEISVRGSNKTASFFYDSTLSTVQKVQNSLTSKRGLSPAESHSISNSLERIKKSTIGKCKTSARVFVSCSSPSIKAETCTGPTEDIDTISLLNALNSLF